MTSSIFGKIEFETNDRSKNIRVRIQASGLKISIPPSTSEREAMRFVESISAKILRKQAQLQSSKQPNLELTYDKKIQTLTFEVSVMASERANIFFSLNNGFLNIEFPKSADLTTHNAQKLCWDGIDYFLKKEAKRILPERTKQLAQKYGFYFRSVKIQSSKSRWGSCSRTQSINYSKYILLLPSHLVDYVILHELCHTKEMNHSEKFWAWMNKVTDNKSLALRTELKKYHTPD